MYAAAGGVLMSRSRISFSSSLRDLSRFSEFLSRRWRHPLMMSFGRGGGQAVTPPHLCPLLACPPLDPPRERIRSLSGRKAEKVR
jgi:hypothetical protein